MAALSSAGTIHYNKAFMPVFRIHRMKDAPRQQFRWAPHVSGAANVKPKDYEPAGEVEAENEYAAWALLRDSEAPLLVGDLLEPTSLDAPADRLRICKYVGFEAAGQHIGLVPRGPQGMASPVAYGHVADIEAKLAEVTAAGGTVKEPAHDVGGGRLVLELAQIQLAELGGELRPLEIACVASEVVAKRCSASAAGRARPRPSVLACQSSTAGVPRTSRRTSARRRTSSTTELATASAIPGSTNNIAGQKLAADRSR